MNLLEFPNEILLEMCKHMDFPSRVSFRKSCKSIHQLITNPKHIVTDEKVSEWREKMKILLGMTFLDNIGESVLLKSPKFRENTICFFVDENSDFCMTIRYGAISFMQIFLNDNREYILDTHDSIIHDHMLFTKYKLQNYKNIFDNKETIGKFLYELYITFLSKDQNKNMKIVSKYQLSHFLNLVMREDIDLYEEIDDIYRSSAYFTFSDICKEKLFKTNIMEKKNELQKDLSRYFMDGDEAEQFLNQWKE